MAIDKPEDPHIHVEVNLSTDTATRDLIVSTFHRAGSLPSIVTTGCGLRAPRAMTSARPEAVTCLACRDHAHGHHLRAADQLERLGSVPGTVVDGDQLQKVAAWHRDLAQRFAEK